MKTHRESHDTLKRNDPDNNANDKTETIMSMGVILTSPRTRLASALSLVLLGLLSGIEARAGVIDLDELAVNRLAKRYEKEGWQDYLYRIHFNKPMPANATARLVFKGAVFADTPIVDSPRPSTDEPEVKSIGSSNAYNCDDKLISTDRVSVRGESRNSQATYTADKVSTSASVVITYSNPFVTVRAEAKRISAEETGKAIMAEELMGWEQEKTLQVPPRSRVRVSMQVVESKVDADWKQTWILSGGTEVLFSLPMSTVTFTPDVPARPAGEDSGVGYPCIGKWGQEWLAGRGQRGWCLASNPFGNPKEVRLDQPLVVGAGAYRVDWVPKGTDAGKAVRYQRIPNTEICRAMHPGPRGNVWFYGRRWVGGDRCMISSAGTDYDKPNYEVLVESAPEAETATATFALEKYLSGDERTLVMKGVTRGVKQTSVAVVNGKAFTIPDREYAIRCKPQEFDSAASGPPAMAVGALPDDYVAAVGAARNARGAASRLRMITDPNPAQLAPIPSSEAQSVVPLDKPVYTRRR